MSTGFPPQLLPCRHCKVQKIEIDQATTSIHLILISERKGNRCPCCAKRSKRVHSWYERQLGDLPCSGFEVKITLRVRRFFCDRSTCQRRIFCERMLDVVLPYARRTKRLSELLRAACLEGGCTAAVKVLQKAGICSSLWAALRLVRQTTLPSYPTPRVLGVDDWALRRGVRYGTVLVDLETGKVVDVLPDREASTLAAWLRAHPGVEVVSRDRAGAYAEGVRLGAPAAIQVADRWHLLKNLGKALKRVMQRHHRLLQQLTTSSTLTLSESKLSPLQPPRVTRTEAVASPTSRRYQRFQQAHQLQQQGLTISAIAQTTGLDRKTVRKYLQLEVLPAYQPRRRRFRILDPYQDYLIAHWQQGQRTVRQLWHDIQAQGYKGSLSVVAAFMAQLRQENGLPPLLVHLCSLRRLNSPGSSSVRCQLASLTRNGNGWYSCPPFTPSCWKPLN